VYIPHLYTIKALKKTGKTRLAMKLEMKDSGFNYTKAGLLAQSLRNLQVEVSIKTALILKCIFVN
jgi:hypothetical protein